MAKDNSNKITVIASDLEGKTKTKHYKDMRKAREFAMEKLGGDFEIRDGKNYAESTTRNMVVMVKNGTLQQLLVDELPATKSGAGKKARQGKCKDEVMELMGIYVEDPTACEELYIQLEDAFVIYKKLPAKEID